MEIRVDHLTRVEGHGNIRASLDGGHVKQAFFEVIEANRFFEGILRGRDWEEVSHIATRICGICAVSHCYASLQATEAALGIQVSDQTKLLRRVTMDAEQISSHALHVYFLVAPDLLGLPSVLPLISQNPDLVKLAFRVKKTGYDLGEVFLGRHTHPVAVVPGGFTSVPALSAVEQIRERIAALRADMEATVSLIQTLELPDFERETEYVCLRQPDHYAFIGGDIISSDGGAVPAASYREAVQEFSVPHSTSKHARWHRDSYRVGAISRVNNNWQQLRPEARKVMEALGYQPPSHNPFMNNIAQVVELVHCIEDAVAACDEILKKGLEDEDLETKPSPGTGVGVVEAPRGLLIHEYTYDERGRCTKANCIIPTGQNYANVDREMQALLPQLAGQPKESVELHLEMLVRSYDPCISCSVH